MDEQGVGITVWMSLHMRMALAERQSAGTDNIQKRDFPQKPLKSIAFIYLLLIFSHLYNYICMRHVWYKNQDVYML